MNRITTFAAACTVSISAIAHAQDLAPSAPPQENPVILVGATAHTISGETIENALVSINEGKIGMVGRADEIMPRISLSENTQIIDLSGKHIYPGLIDSVTILGLEEVSAVRATRDHNEVGDMTPEVRAYVAVNPDSTVIPVARTNGILTAGVAVTGGTIPGRASVISTDGWTTEDLAISRDAGLIISLNDNNIDRLDKIFAQALAYSQAHNEIDQRLEAITTVLPDQSDNNEQNPVFMRANTYEQITKSINWALKHNLKPIIVGGRDAYLCTDLLTSTNTPVIIGGTYTFPKRADAPYDARYTLPKKLNDAGVRWSLTMSSRFGHERNLPDAAAIAVAHGLSQEAALHGITLGAAQILGVDHLIGSIEPGKYATLIVTDGNILETTTLVEAAYIQGRSIDLTNKQTELRDTYREKYRQLNMID
ncbi:MAG: amidohydrolase family protein [Phycisphaerales bacterium]|nr:amidohydrolase family protein [Phycisphaerales bacterium]